MLRPQAVDDTGLHHRAGAATARSWSRGAKPERWVRQTNFDNDEAVGYLADRLARLGVEEALAKAGRRARLPGAHRRARVRLAARPSTPGAEFTPGQRGTDYRLDETRPGPRAAERLAARKARRRPYEHVARPSRADGRVIR